MSSKTFQDKSYQQHSEGFRDYARDGKLAAQARAWFATDTVDAWRHQRMYQALDPLLAAEPQSHWLTVGDGRYGKDAHYIGQKGPRALATDISEYLLKEACDSGFIPAYKVENAEMLSFADAEFDYVFCKESYHHFPRPMLALYEMLRVSRKGVLLIEPNDGYVHSLLMNVARFFLGGTAGKHSFEDVGNYVYRISRREMEKVALGVNYRTVAFKGINDAYFEGVGTEKMADKGPLQRKTRLLIAIRDLLCRLRLVDYNLLAAIIFKEAPAAAVREQLKGAGYTLVDLPRNPYIPE